MWRGWRPLRIFRPQTGSERSARAGGVVPSETDPVPVASGRCVLKPLALVKESRTDDREERRRERPS